MKYFAIFSFIFLASCTQQSQSTQVCEVLIREYLRTQNSNPYTLTNKVKTPQGYLYDAVIVEDKHFLTHIFDCEVNASNYTLKENHQIVTSVTLPSLKH